MLITYVFLASWLPTSSLFYQFSIFLNQWSASKHCLSENFFFFAVCVWWKGGGEGLRGCIISVVILYTDHRVQNLGKTASSSNSFAFIKIWSSSVPVNSDLCCPESVLHPYKSAWESVFDKVIDLLKLYRKEKGYSLLQNCSAPPE